MASQPYDTAPEQMQDAGQVKMEELYVEQETGVPVPMEHATDEHETSQQAIEVQNMILAKT